MAPSHKQKVLRLYKLILRLHRGMPKSLEVLGSNYVRDEFHRHQNCKPNETEVFMREWTKYAITLSKQLQIFRPDPSEQLAKIGKEMSIKDLDHFRDDQLMQLYDLMSTTKELPEEGKSKKDM